MAPIRDWTGAITLSPSPLRIIPENAKHFRGLFLM